MDWDQVHNHARRLADAGYETTVHVAARPDPQVARVLTIRVAKSSIPTSQELTELLADAKKDGLDIDGLELERDEYIELR